MLLSSHILSEVEALCDRVTIIRAGRTVESGALADLRHLTRTSIDAELAGPPPDWPLPGVHDLDVDRRPGPLPGRQRRAGGGAAPAHRAGVRSLVSQPPTLEELFLRHYGPEQARPTAVGAATAAGRPGGLTDAGRDRGADPAGAAPGPDPAPRLDLRLTAVSPAPRSARRRPTPRPAAGRWRTASGTTRVRGDLRRRRPAPRSASWPPGGPGSSPRGRRADEHLPGDPAHPGGRGGRAAGTGRRDRHRPPGRAGAALP